YEFQSPRFSLPGSMGCTAALNLGIYLLRTFYRYPIRQVDMLFIFDAHRLAERLRFNLPVADNAIMEYCSEQNASLMARSDKQPDCHKWIQCEGQPGTDCDIEALKCR